MTKFEDLVKLLRLGRLEMFEAEITKNPSDAGLADESGFTLLMASSRYRRPESTKFLCGIKGLDLNAVDKWGWSVGHYAAKAGCNGCAKAWLEAGGNPSLETKDDKSARMIAESMISVESRGKGFKNIVRTFKFAEQDKLRGGKRGSCGS